MRSLRLTALLAAVFAASSLPVACGTTGSGGPSSTGDRPTTTSTSTTTASGGGSGGAGTTGSAGGGGKETTSSGGSGGGSGGKGGGSSTGSGGSSSGAGGNSVSSSGAGGSIGTTGGSGAGGASATTGGSGAGGSIGTTGGSGAGGAGGASATTGGSGTTGGMSGCVDAMSCPSPPNPCAVATCVNGACGVGAAAAGSPCLGGKCDGNGVCVQCLSGADCASKVCAQGVCAAATCMDAVKNGAETDIDCGGGACPDCVNGKGCASGADCLSNLCMGNVCVAPSCMDGLKNGAETDIDCGGGACPTCVDGKTCVLAGDCQSNSCVGGTCVPVVGPACLSAAPNPATGQRCPLFMPCNQFSDCGVFQGCQQWFCNPSGTCELNALSNCWTDVGGGCNANVVYTQQTQPPVDKDFLPPDGVNFRELASLVLTIQNNTVNDLYLDKIPLQLDVAGGGSSFDVSTVKMYQDLGGTEHSLGDQYVCLTGNPFSFPANGILGNGPEGGCAGSAFSKIAKNGGTRRFVIEVAFAANKVFIAGRSYRLKISGAASLSFKVGFNGVPFAGTTCGIPGAGFVGAWVHAKNP